jgi:hypothetical protein
VMGLACRQHGPPPAAPPPAPTLAPSSRRPAWKHARIVSALGARWGSAWVAGPGGATPPPRVRWGRSPRARVVHQCEQEHRMPILEARPNRVRSVRHISRFPDPNMTRSCSTRASSATLSITFSIS